MNGKIFRFDNRPDAQAAEIADLKQDLPKFLRLLGQFDPNFAKNRQVYVCINTENKTLEGSRISRFELTRSESRGSCWRVKR